jgi:DNA polymerase III alpha subunit (gram-positive type)
MNGNKTNFLNSVVILDTETTGINPKTSEIVELATGIYEDGILVTESSLFKSIAPISFRASAVSNISNKMVEDKLTITENWIRVYELLKFNDKAYAVAHNSKFDSAMLETAYVSALTELDEAGIIVGYEDVKWLCTYRLAKRVFADCPDIGFKLGELRYYFDLEVPEDLVLHRADADIIVCGSLLEYIIDYAIKTDQLQDTVNIGDDLYDLCWSPIPITKMPFGKHKDELIADVPTSYLLWVAENHDSVDETSNKFDEDFSNTIIAEMENRLK